MSGQGDFTPAGDRVDHVAWLAKTRAFPPDPLHHGLACIRFHPEMAGSGHRFALEKIIGTDGYTLESVEEIPHGFEGVVHTPQEDRLIGNGNSCL